MREQEVSVRTLRFLALETREIVMPFSETGKPEEEAGLREG